MAAARALGVSAVTAALVACSLGDAASPARDGVVAPAPRDFAGGSRLRPRVWTIGGAVDVLASFHDVAQGVDCAFADAAGAHVGPGAVYACLPTSLARHRDGAGPYADASCTERVGLVAPGETPSFVVVEPGDACTSAPVVHRAAEIVDARAPYRRDAAGACVRDGARARWVTLGERLADDTWVRAIEVTEPRGGAIDARVLVASDGARLVVGGFDPARAQAVTPGFASDGVRRWLPSRLAFAGGGEVRFEDPSCTRPLATKIARDAVCPLGAALVFRDTCGNGELRALGAPVDPRATFRVDDEGKCVAAGPGAGVLAFAMGAPIAPSSFARVEVLEVGLGAVRRRASAAAGGAVVALHEVVDAATGAPCVVARSPDGALRCAPRAVASVSFFADPACTSPAFVDAIDPCDPSARPPSLVRGVDGRIFRVRGEAIAAYALDAGSCTRFVAPVPSRAFAVEEVDPSVLVEVREHVE